MAKRLNGEIVRPVFVIIVGVAGLLIVYLLPEFWIKKMDGRATQAILSEKIIKPPVSEGAGKKTPEISRADIKRDPFLPSYMRLEARPSGMFSPEELGLSLSGIIWDEKDPVAIINGEVMRVGGVVNGKKILEIKKDQVIFGEGEARYTVTIWQ